MLLKQYRTIEQMFRCA